MAFPQTTMIVSMVLAVIVMIASTQGQLDRMHVEHPVLLMIFCGLLTAVLQFMIPLYDLRRQIRKAERSDLPTTG